MNIVEIKKLTKYYGKDRGIINVDLNIEEGEIFGFIGPNGAGKSTTIRLLLDLIRPTSGKALIFGKQTDIEPVNIHKEVGYLPGEIFLDEGITGKETLDFFKGFKDKVDDKYLSDLLSRFDLKLKTKVGEYSKGNKQKLAIILALMHKPKLLILDEPTSGLDPVNQQIFYKTIEETKKWGATTFFSTHILEEAERICDRVGIIKDGKLLKIENIDEFREKNIRNIHIQTQETIPVSSIKANGVKKIEKIANGYHITTMGNNGEIIRQLSKYKIADFVISEPSLEEIFMHYYKD